jgi:hypothetical protein
MIDNPFPDAAMRLCLEDLLHYFLRPHAHRGCPLDQPQWWPVQMCTVRSGSMLVISHTAAYGLAVRTCEATKRSRGMNQMNFSAIKGL